MKTYIEINSRNLLANLRFFKEKTQKKVMLVVKANAYGHGLKEVVEITRHCPYVDYYAVDTAEEALTIRREGAQQPILVIGWADREELELIIRHGFETVVPSIEHFRTAGELARKIGRTCRIHLKVETGAARLGMEPASIIKFLKGVSQNNLEIGGVYSHFANIEDTTQHAYARQQLHTFNQFLKKVGQRRWLKHFSCSASTLLFPETQFDMVRIGISAYGYWPSKQTYVSYLEKNGAAVRLRPVLNWYTKVAQVKTLDKGAFVGYGLTYRTYSKAKIVIIPVGYYDGYDRRLSNMANVIIRGCLAPVRGRICMNMFMSEVTHIKGIRVGDRVTLIGGERKDTIDAEQLADVMGTINYEVLARINPGIPRFIV